MPDGGVDRIVQVTAGHPYLVQLVCDALCRHLNENGRLEASTDDLEAALDALRVFKGRETDKPVSILLAEPADRLATGESASATPGFFDPSSDPAPGKPRPEKQATLAGTCSRLWYRPHLQAHSVGCGTGHTCRHMKSEVVQATLAGT